MVSQTVLLLYIQKQKGVFQNMKKQKITTLLLTMALCASAVLSGCAASAASQMYWQSRFSGTGYPRYIFHLSVCTSPRVAPSCISRLPAAHFASATPIPPHYRAGLRFLSRSSTLCAVSSPCGVDTSASFAKERICHCTSGRTI